MAKRVLLGLVTVALLASPSLAFNYTLYNFGDNPFDHNNNWSPISYPCGIGNQPSPGTLGEGGEKFDLEALKIASDDDYIYVALANSFGYTAHSTGWNQDYRLGDLFIGVNGCDKYQYAIDITSSGSAGLYSVSSWNGVQNVFGSYYGTSIASQAGAHEMAAGTKLGDVTSVKTFWEDLEKDYLSPGNGDTYVWEFAFEKSLLGDFSNLDFHLTLGCGNDLMEESLSAIPEPVTILLFGFGLLGAGIIRRCK